MTAETAALVAPREGARRIPFGWLWSAALLLILTFLVIYPVSMLVLGALTNTNPVVDGLSVYDLSLKNFITVLGNPNVHYALANSLIACGGGTALAVIIGLTFSWVVVRTNTPCKRFIAAVSMIPLFVPPLVAAVAWSILASPKTGLLNMIIKWAGPRGLQAARERCWAGRAGSGKRASSHSNRSSGFFPNKRSAADVPSDRLSQ